MRHINVFGAYTSNPRKGTFGHILSQRTETTRREKYQDKKENQELTPVKADPPTQELLNLVLERFKPSLRPEW
jgi:hypothetical protein